MLTYEVTAEVDPALTGAYERYMIDAHIPDVLASGCFAGAALVRSGANRYRGVYRVEDQQTLDRYLEEHAPRLRADFAGHFPTGVTLSREVWNVLEQWPAGGR